jgi:hypothetical protein
MAKFGGPKKPAIQPGKSSKPANQGSAGNSKAVTQQPRKDGMPKAAKPGASVTMLSKQPSGTRGSK